MKHTNKQMGIFFYIIASLFLFLFVKAVNWFIDPFVQYTKSRGKSRDYLLFSGGRYLSKEQIGVPNLLQAHPNLVPGSAIERSQAKERAANQIDLSLVVPAFNEQDRLPAMLREHVEFILEEQSKGELPATVEILIVDDGSKDNTWN